MSHKLTSRIMRLGAATALLAGLLLASLPAPVARAATITVNTRTDEVNTDGDCSLREAIIAANEDRAVDGCIAGSGADTIILPGGQYPLTLAGRDEDDALTGDLDITDDLTLRGSRFSVPTIDARAVDRVIYTRLATVVQISNVIITGGHSDEELGSGLYHDGDTLSLSNVRVTANAPEHAIFVDAHSTLNILASEIDNNLGGAIYIRDEGAATVINSVIHHNSGTAHGGGAMVWGDLTVVNSTISSNSATISSGGIFVAGNVQLYNVTIANNDGGHNGGGVVINRVTAYGVLTTRNSIIANNRLSNSTSASPDCAGPLTSDGHNLIGDTTGCTIEGDPTGNRLDVDPRLDRLQDNGGDTLTHGLLFGSPANNGGDLARWCFDHNGELLQTDQRGFARYGVCDMGAFERNSPGTPTPTASVTRTPTATDTGAPVEATPTLTGTPALTSTAVPTSSATGIAGATATATRTATASYTPTEPGDATPTATQTWTATPTHTQPGTVTPGPSPTPASSATGAPTSTATATHAPTATPTAPGCTPGPDTPCAPAPTASPFACSAYCVLLPIVLK